MVKKEKECNIDNLQPFFCRVGAKRRLIRDICKLIPPHEIYVEPFLGGGSVFWYKNKANKNYLNDLDDFVVNNHKLLKNLDLNQTYTFPQWTNKEATKFVYDTKHTTNKQKFIAGVLQSCGTYSAMGQGNIYVEKSKNPDKKGRYKNRGKDLRNKLENKEKLEKYKNKLKGVSITKQDYKILIKKYDSPRTFFFLDPPYEEAEKDKLYKKSYFNMEELLKVVKSIKGKFMLTLNDSPNIRRLFSGYNIKTLSLGHVGGTSQIGKARTELLIMNYNPSKLEGKGKSLKNIIQNLLPQYDFPDNMTDDEYFELIEIFNLEPQLRGAGFWNWIKTQYRKGKSLISAPAEYSNTSRETLNKYGKCVITKLTIIRTPIQEVLGIALQGLSFGEWYKLMRKYGYDKMFHLALIGLVCDNVPVVIEKNEVVNISNEFSLSKDSEYMEVDLEGETITLDEMMNKTKSFMGDFNYFDYDAFKNNCQVFIDSVLKSNGLLTQNYHKFLFQDLQQLHQELPSYIAPVAKFITRLGSIVSRLRGGKGKLGDLLDKKKYPLNYSKQVEDIISNMSFGNEVEILGSMSFKSQLYTSDYDCFEVVRVNSINELKTKFQTIIKNLKSMKKVYIGDIKIGEIKDWKIIDDTAYIDNAGKLRGYNQEKSMNKLGELLNEKIISKKEYEESKKLLIKNPNYEELKNIIKQVRFNVVRWTPTEILKGKKTIRGKPFTIEEGFKSHSLFKLDVIALMEGKYTDFSIIYDVRLKGKRLNYFGIDTKQTLLNDIHLYHSVGNWFKFLKRLFSYYNYLIKYQKTNKKKKYIDNLEKIIDILNSDIGNLYTIIQDIEVILFLMEKGITPRRDFINEINNFVNSISDIYSIVISPHLINRIKKIQEYKTNKKIKNSLENIQKDLTALLNKKTKEEINNKKIMIN